MERNLVPVAGVAVAVSVLQVAAGPTSLASSSHVIFCYFYSVGLAEQDGTVNDFFFRFFFRFFKIN